MPLVADQPVAPAPVAKVHRARQVRHRLCRIGNIAGAAGRRLVETKADFWADIDGRQRRRAAAGTGERPGSGAIPAIFAGVVDGGGGPIGGRAALLILVEVVKTTLFLGWGG